MSKRTRYEELALMPSVVAMCVCEEPYTQQELSRALRDPNGSLCKSIEAKRAKLTHAQIGTFATAFDDFCRHAYEAKADWFVKCARSKTNAGRDQLYVWARHRMAGWLASGRLPGAKR